MVTLRVTLSQLDPVLGDFKHNILKAKEAIDAAEATQSDLVLFPELFLAGHPAQDLLLRKSFLNDCKQAIDEIVQYTKNKKVVCVLGSPLHDGDTYNAAIVIRNGEILGAHRKTTLSEYFLEGRYFQMGHSITILRLGSLKLGLTINEDLFRSDRTLTELLKNGVRVILNVRASPYVLGEWKEHEERILKMASKHGLGIVSCNMAGAQDEIVFAGASFACDASGNLLARARLFEEEIVTVDIDLKDDAFVSRNHTRRAQTIDCGETRDKEGKVRSSISPSYTQEQEMFVALVTGLRAYVRKNGFKKVVLGLSGGIDSSLVATIAVEALGAENVKGVLMPSMYTSKESVEDALQLAQNLGIETFTIPITDVYEQYLKALATVFSNAARDATEENIQARVRGNYLMALSNKFGWLVLTTGNKSEVATGYCTLYGDTAGGFAVISDIYKTDVYRIARWYNSWKGKQIIPERVFTKPPTAELRPGQTDQEKLPPYEVLDGILKLYIEENLDARDIVERGYDSDTVIKVLHMIRANEYKRRQLPIGIKISKRTLSKDWHMPVTNRFTEPA